MSRIDDLIKKHCPDGVKFKKLHKVAKLQRGCSFKISKYSNKGIRVIRVSDVQKGKISDKALRYYPLERQNEVARCLIKENDLVMSLTGNVGRVAVLNQKDLPAGICQDVMRIRANDTSTSTRYLYHFFDQDAFENAAMNNASGACQKHMNPKWFSSYPVPVPPLEVQEEIVRILDTFTKLEAELKAELKARQQQYSHYRDELLNSNFRTMTLSDIGDVKMCKRILKKQTTPTGEIPFYKIGTFGKTSNASISRELFEEYVRKYSFPKKGDVLISASGTIGRTVTYDGKPAYFQDSNIVWIDNDEKIVSNKYLGHFYKVAKWFVSGGGTINRLYNDNIRKTKILVPSIEQQKRIVAILDKFDALVNDISVGLPAEIEARRQQYEHYRNQLLTFKEAC